MLRELIAKLKARKQQLQNHEANNDVIEAKLVEENDVDIKISKDDNILKIEISDYISIGDYVKKMESSDEYSVLDLLCNCVLWGHRRQKVNKGIYYVIVVDNRLYNILFADEKIIIDERTKKELDKQTQKKDITQERVITFYINTNDYHYYSAKHESNRNTYYTKYYNKNRTYSLGTLDLSEEETYDEISSVIHNLENIEGIENILDIALLKTNILGSFHQGGKCYQNYKSHSL